MKLKLRAHSTETLRACFAQISSLRKTITLRFSPDQLVAVSINVTAATQEPQIWCKFKMSELFSEIEIQSLRENVIPIELNVDLLLQTLRNFDQADSHDLSIRLMKKDTGTSAGRTAFLSLNYSETNVHGNTVSRLFRIPVTILKSATEALREPDLPKVDLMMRLSNSFVATYKRLEKFKRGSGSSDLVTVRASRRNGGYLGFVLREEGQFKVTISWNGKLDVQKPENGFDSDSMRGQLLQELTPGQHEGDEEKEVTVRLRDWKMASKIVGTCKTVILLVCNREACAIHCLLDDSDDVEMVYYINAVRTRDYE